MIMKFTDINSAIIYEVCQSIIGAEESATDAKKATLALYLINIITLHSSEMKDYYSTIGDGNIFQALVSDNAFLEEFYTYYGNQDYKSIGEFLSTFLITTAKKYTINVSHDVNAIN